MYVMYQLCHSKLTFVRIIRPLVHIEVDVLKTAQATRCLWSSLLLKRREGVFSSSLENCFNESRGLIEERLAPNKLATFFFYHLQLLNYLVPRSRNVVEADERGWWSDGWLDVAEKIRWGLLKCKSYHDSISRWKNNYRNVSDHLQLVNLMDKVHDMLNTLSPRNTPPPDRPSTRWLLKHSIKQGLWTS